MPAVTDGRTFLALAGFLVCAALPLTAVRASPLSGSFSLGAEYDSNVSIDETDLNARQGDAAALVSASVDLKAVNTKSVTLNLGYSYDGTFRQNIKQYDLDIHQALAGLAVKRGKASFNLDYKFAYIRLDGGSFLNLNYVSPSLSGFISDRVYARLGYSYLKKAYKISDALDAETRTVSFDIYRLFAGRKAYVAIGLRQDDENATGPQYDYRARQASVRAMVPFRLVGAPIKLRLSYAYGERDYQNETPSIGERRAEKRSTYGVALDVPLIRRLTFKPSFRYVDRTSNVPLFDYREHTINGVLQYRL